MSSSLTDGCLAVVAGILSLAVLASSFRSRPTLEPVPINVRQAPAVARKLDEPLLPNLHQLTADLYCGGVPRGEAGLERLAALGIKTIISVDGERPQVELARKHGLRYVHLPIGYDQVPRKDVVALVAATHRLPLPLYVHCHRGLHRSPAAALALWRLQNPALDGETAQRLIREIGTAARYSGLYDSVRDMTPLTPEETATLETLEFVEVAQVGTLVEQMVEIEATWERLKPALGNADSRLSEQARRDVTHLAEQLKEAGRLRRQETDGELARTLDRTASELLDSTADPADLELSAADLRTRIQKHCNDCHGKFRDHIVRP